jgi:hypothetical protein
MTDCHVVTEAVHNGVNQEYVLLNLIRLPPADAIDKGSATESNPLPG